MNGEGHSLSYLLSYSKPFPPSLLDEVSKGIQLET